MCDTKIIPCYTILSVLFAVPILCSCSHSYNMSAKTEASTEYSSEDISNQTTDLESSLEESGAQDASTSDIALYTEENKESVPYDDISVTPIANSPISKVIVIDPGHQSKGNYDTEPNAPGNSTQKAKVSSGTIGTSTGVYEYELNLTIALKLKSELEHRGYTVIMTRESNDVNISNVERATLANEANADAFIRIHANGADDSSIHGAMTICQTSSNPSNGDKYTESKRLSECILDAYTAETGIKKLYVWETDTMTGINWANIPSTIVEMGYMTNPSEDVNMQDPDFQFKMVMGIANGIDNYFS